MFECCSFMNLSSDFLLMVVIYNSYVVFECCSLMNLSRDFLLKVVIYSS